MTALTVDTQHRLVTYVLSYHADMFRVERTPSFSSAPFMGGNMFTCVPDLAVLSEVWWCAASAGFNSLEQSPCSSSMRALALTQYTLRIYCSRPAGVPGHTVRVFSLGNRFKSKRLPPVGSRCEVSGCSALVT